MHKYINELIHESSPYLLQHAHNPVNWYPWGDKALGKAKKENKMLIISIGYSACHWCHVMEHESYEDTAVAQVMNDNFICIKVDREERPDIDQVYMNAAFLVNGSGGWPLNVLALPDGKPFFAGTYYPRETWIKVLDYFVNEYEKNPSVLRNQAKLITEGIKSSDIIDFSHDASVSSLKDMDNIFNKLESHIDFKKGGMNQTIKFPMPSMWEYLLNYYYLAKNPDALKAVLSTLDNMAAGGIYDQAGGGFSRYSTDENWHIPHFEKMLYDNGQLVSLYSHAWQLTKNSLYKEIVYQTIEFIEREMTSPGGGFYSSLDADSEGEEGKFYAWTYEEVVSVLQSEAPLFIDYYNITRDGNWEDGKNILYRKLPDAEFAKRYSLNLADPDNRLARNRRLILESRNKRVRPQTDDKILTSWNAIMLKGYVDAYRAFGERRFLTAALKNADFLCRFAINEDNEITRNYHNGKSAIPGLLDDYSFTISAFIDLYQATFDEKWLYKANELAGYAILHFSDKASGMFFYTPDNQSDLIARKMEIGDNVIPSSNSEMASNLFMLGNFFDNETFIQKAGQMMRNVRDKIHQNIYSFSNWGSLELKYIKPLYEVAIVGQEWDQIRTTMESNYLPDAVFLGGMDEGTMSLLENKLVTGQTTIYVCSEKTCKRPVKEAKEALEQMKITTTSSF
jgi:uncharacterized protein YyaL (SSP411 family)